MKMSIDEAALYMELYKRKLFDSVSDLDKDIEAYDIVIDTVRKYHKIQEIMGELNGNFYGSYLKDRQTLEKIYEVMEDEDDD